MLLEHAREPGALGAFTGRGVEVAGERSVGDLQEEQPGRLRQRAVELTSTVQAPAYGGVQALGSSRS